MVASVGVLISSLEALSMRAQYQDHGLFGWPTLRTRSALTAGAGFWAHLLTHFLAYPNVLYLLSVRAMAAASLIIGVGGLWTRLAIASIFVTDALIFGVRHQRRTGAESMGRIIFGALFLAQVVANSSLAEQACLWFIALQACLAYAGNGWSKLRQPVWREGTVVFTVTHSRIFGYPPAARLLRRHPFPGKLLTWGALAMECLFPLVLVAGRPACWIFLGGGLAFHLLNGFFMGLNNFLWMFAATYPAILYSVDQVARLIHG